MSNTTSKRSKNGNGNGNSQSILANKLAEALRALHEEVPGFKLLDHGRGRTLSMKWTIDPKYIEAAIATIAANPKIQAMTEFDAEAARMAIRVDAAYATPEAVARELVDGIHGMRMTQYTAAIDECDHLLAVAQALLKQPKARLTPTQLKELESFKAAVESMTSARKLRRKATVPARGKATPKKAAQQAKQASVAAQRATVKAQKASARAQKLAARVAGAALADSAAVRPATST